MREMCIRDRSSTCQMIALLLLKGHYQISQNVASNLFLGIVSDSDRFLLSYTSVDTFQIVTDLIRRTNLPFVSLYEKLYERPIEEIRFHGYIATHLTVTENGFAYIEISDEILKEYHVCLLYTSLRKRLKQLLIWLRNLKKHLFRLKF